MQNGIRQLFKWTLAGVLLFAIAGCNNTPTVPLPPPDVTVVSTTEPDTDGMVTVTGGDNAADPDSIVLLYNEDAETGVMEAAEQNGAFEARVEAKSGDTLVLQYKIDSAISYEEYIQIK